MKTAYYTLRLHVLALTLSTSLSAFAGVTASLDRDHIAPGETVRLLVQRDGNSNSQPDLGALKQDFDVVGNNRASSVQIINGKMSAKTQINLLLAPKHNGTIHIPPLQWDGEQSGALEITIDGSGASSGSGNSAQTSTQTPSSHVFLTATLDRKQIYVQAAAVLTVRLHADETLAQASLDLPANNDVLVRQLGKDVTTSESRNGRDYQVVERKYLLFPQRSGSLKLDGALLDARVADAQANDPFGNDGFFANPFGRSPFSGMLNSTRPLRLRSDPIELNVLPRPTAATGPVWLPAKSVTLTENWRPENAEIHVGEPLTRHLHLAATGLTAAQLPDLGALMTVPNGVKTYPDQAQLDDHIDGNTVLGSRDQDIALIASQPGPITLPALKIDWWDTEKNVLQEVNLPARKINILPATAGSGNIEKPMLPATTPPLQNAGPTSIIVPPPLTTAKAAAAPWQWISLVLGLLWLGTLTAWWVLNRRSQGRAPVKVADRNEASQKSPSGNHLNAFKAFQAACRTNDAKAARTHLLTWANGAWPDEAPFGLNALARRLNDAKLTDLLRQLDRACYAGGDWLGKLLAEHMQKPPLEKFIRRSEQNIPALYP